MGWGIELLIQNHASTIWWFTNLDLICEWIDMKDLYNWKRMSQNIWKMANNDHGGC